MKKVKSPTGCVHIVDGGYKNAWTVKCGHRDYFRWDGEEHSWPLTKNEVTCKRCLAMQIREEGPQYTVEIMYRWPATQVCSDCRHAENADVGDAGETYVICNMGCKLNNGKSCPEKVSYGR